jgi:hypothetical protein
MSGRLFTLRTQFHFFQHPIISVACRANTSETLRKSRRIDPISAEYRPELSNAFHLAGTDELVVLFDQ